MTFDLTLNVVGTVLALALAFIAIIGLIYRLESRPKRRGDPKPLGILLVNACALIMVIWSIWQ